MLVLALDLEEVEEVCAAGADLDQVLRGMRSGSGEGGHEEVLGAGDVFGYLNSFHLRIYQSR